MIECKVTHEELSAYIDGELSSKEMETIVSHLNDCEKCQNEIEELESLNSVLSDHFDVFRAGLNLDSLFPDLKAKIKSLDEIKEDEVDKIIQFPSKEEKDDKNKIYQFIPGLVALAAIFLISFGIMKSNFVETKASVAKTDSTTVDSLEYSKFNAMIYKTKDKNKTVIWLFDQGEEEEVDTLDDSI